MSYEEGLLAERDYTEMSQGIGANKEMDDRDEILAHGEEPRRTSLAPEQLEAQE